MDEFNLEPTIMDLESDNNYLIDNIVDIDKSNIDQCLFDVSAFQSGVFSLSELCGQITALVNVGITPSQAMDYLINKDSSSDMMRYSKEIAEIQANASVESSKYEGNNSQRMMI